MTKQQASPARLKPCPFKAFGAESSVGAETNYALRFVLSLGILIAERQPENRGLPQSGDIPARRFLFRRQVQRPAVLTPVNFRVVAKLLPHISAGLLQHISLVEPPL